MKITIVYDNEASPPLISDWGFSVLIETDETTLLFDTGAKSEILFYNMNELGIDPKNIASVVLSHNHWDHTGGLRSLLEIKPDLTIYKPTFSNKPKGMYPNIMSTGALRSWSGIQEQALLCKTTNGLVVVTGCSHPGLENILDIAKKYGRIYAIIGGFHGFNKYDELLEIPIIVPCHCTSNKREIRTIFSDTYKECRVGKSFKFGDVHV